VQSRDGPAYPPIRVDHHAHAESLVFLVILVGVDDDRHLRAKRSTRDRRGACAKGLQALVHRLPVLCAPRISPVTETARRPRYATSVRREGLLEAVSAVRAGVIAARRADRSW